MAQPVLSSALSLRLTAPAGGTTVGVAALIGDYFCLPNDTVLVNVPVECDLAGEWLLPKATPSLAPLAVFAEGEAVYWDETNDQCDKAGRFIGHASGLGGAAAAATTMRVRIDPRAHKPGAAAGVARLVLDASSAPKAAGTYYGDSIPDNARVTRSWYEVVTTFTDGASDTATISLGVETDDVAGIIAAVSIATGTPWDAGLKDGIQDGAIGNFGEITTAEGRRLEAVVAVATLTAGLLVLVAEWAVTAS